jgi:hypothetical protein
MKGNKEDGEKVIYGLYYEDTLLQDNVLLLTYENRDDAISTRKAIEKAYSKNDCSTANVFKILLAVAILLICGKYLLTTNTVSIAKQERPVSQENVTNPNYDREAIMKSVEEFKEKQKNEKNALQEQNSNDSIGQSSDVKANTASSPNEEIKTQGQDFADFLNEKK